MIGIKKVQVVALDVNDGKIIDSFNTQDNHQTNAPSLNAVENYVSNVQSGLEYDMDTINNDIDTINNTFANYKLKGDFAIITGTITLSSGSGSATGISYPDGFTQENCVCISVGTTRSTGGALATRFEYFTVSSVINLGVYLNASDITLNATNSAKGPSVTVPYKIVLMKIS